MQNKVGLGLNKQERSQQRSSWLTGAGGAALSMLGGFIGAGHQHRRQRELMGLQNQYQRGLNQQGFDLQKRMWEETSYPAQLAMMKKAGLSPGLMYGGGPGAGGTTGSQGGGSAAGGSAAAFQPMDLSNMMLMDAQKRAIDEGIEKSKWERGDKGTAEINNLEASARELGSREKLNIVNAGLTEAKIHLTERQEALVVEQINKTITDTAQIRKIIDMDYSDVYGKNTILNLTKMLDLTPGEGGELGLDDAGKIATVVGTVAVLKSRAFAKGASNTIKTKLSQAWNWIKRNAGKITAGGAVGSTINKKQ